MFQFLLIFSFKGFSTSNWPTWWRRSGASAFFHIFHWLHTEKQRMNGRHMLLWTGHFPPGLQTLLRVCENERCKEQLYIHYSAKSKYVCAWWDLLGVSAGQPVHPVLPFSVILQVLVCNICKGIYTFLANTTINSRWRHCFWVLFGVVGRNQISSMTFSWVVENIRSKVVRIYFTEDSY